MWSIIRWIIFVGSITVCDKLTIYSGFHMLALIAGERYLIQSSFKFLYSHYLSFLTENVHFKKSYFLLYINYKESYRSLLCLWDQKSRSNKSK